MCVHVGRTRAYAVWYVCAHVDARVVCEQFVHVYLCDVIVGDVSAWVRVHV